MKHPTIQVVAFLGLGAVLNVLVAWGLLAGSGVRSPSAPPAGVNRPYGPRTDWPRGTPTTWPEPDSTYQLWSAGVRVSVLGATAVQNEAGTWGAPLVMFDHHRSMYFDMGPSTAAQAAAAAQYGGGWLLSAANVRCGWPWLAMELTRWDLAALPGAPAPAAAPSLVAHPSWWQSGVPASPPPKPGGAQLRMPIRPLWAGFLANAAVLGAGAAVASRVPCFILRRFRRRCGLCLDCGYPAGALPVCAECGSALTPVPPPRLPRRTRRPLVAWVLIVAAMTLMYPLSARWGLCFKSQTGWYGGFWAGRLALGYSRTPFMAPGVETGRFAVPFTLGFQRSTDGSRWIVGVPFWSVLLLMLPAIGRTWWRYAVYRTISARHPPPAKQPLAPA